MIEPITMDRDTARARARAYRTALHRRADAEYSAALAGYEALAEGTPLLMLSEAIRAGGFGLDGRPRMAVARADRKQVEVQCFGWNPPRSVHYSTTQMQVRDNSLLTYSLDLAIPKEFKRGFALVPMIPPEHHPGDSKLRDHLILWEVETWADSRIGARPPVDPFLLKSLGGDLYAVVGQWDLTPLEQAIIAGTRKQS